MRLLAISFVMVIAVISPAKACVCAQPTPGTPAELAVHEQLAFASAVFEASVLSNDVGSERSETRMHVTRVWKGDVSERLTIVQEGGDCQFPFAERQTYIVYAARTSSGFNTNLCSGTTDLPHASVDLRILGRSHSPTLLILGLRPAWFAAAVCFIVLAAFFFAVRLHSGRSGYT